MTCAVDNFDNFDNVDHFDYWRDAEAARDACGCCDDYADDDGVDNAASDDEDEYGNNVLMEQARRCSESMVRMPDGDIHICKGSACEHAIVQKDGELVCPYSGLVVGLQAVDRTDYSTGRSTWSNDPDMHTGPVGGAWKRKIDRMAASKAAHTISNQLNDEEMPAAKSMVKLDKAVLKRGARCVDEAKEEEVVGDDTAKRHRNSKKNASSINQINVLVVDSMAIYSKLLTGKVVSKENAAPQKTVASPTTAKAEAAVGVDSRLLNREALFQAALQRYLKEQLAAGVRPCLDDIHNISLTVEAIVGNEQRKLQAAAAPTTSTKPNTPTTPNKVRSVQFRGAVARLAVSIWVAAQHTDYLINARRGGDSFRPFIVGVFFALKRGLKLGNGAVLVPAIVDFEDALPTAREIADLPSVKSLHASSHRGLCSIHRCISSMDEVEQNRVFADALRISQELSRIAA